ncbi:hypothetical protein TrLO_g3338 [Triparma laevis f. longispina]|uniref:SAP domain-containing protein n=1 Tax=Triparma laevis f. longispina TaxID=1714387 RepID=A0A9W7FPH9_9STRA|nr:hypothetical protein TrLO_g3338 [Triparma laevis f. longispina]
MSFDFPSSPPPPSIPLKSKSQSRPALKSIAVNQSVLPVTKEPNKMKVSELRLSLSRRNLSTTGLKKDLLSRLLEFIDKENAIVSASAAKSSNRSVSAPKNPRQIPVTFDEALLHVHPSSPPHFPPFPPKNLALLLRRPQPSSLKTLKTSLTGLPTSTTTFSSLHLPLNETLLGFTPTGQYFITVTSSCSELKYYYIHIIGEALNEGEFFSPKGKRKFSSWELDESINISYVAEDDPVKQIIKISPKPESTHPASFQFKGVSQHLNSRYRFLENDITSIPFTLLLHKTSNFYISQIRRPGVLETGDTPGRGRGEVLNCFVVGEGEGCGCGGRVCLNLEVEEDEEVGGGVYLNAGSCCKFVDNDVSGVLCMHENKECVWLSVVGESKKEEKKKVVWKDDVSFSSSSTSNSNASSTPSASNNNFLHKPKTPPSTTSSSTFTNLEPPLPWSHFCSTCSTPSPPSQKILTQKNISYEPLIRKIMTLEKAFQKCRLTDYCMSVVGARTAGRSIIFAAVLEVEPRDAHLHIHQGRVPLLLKGLIVSVNWNEVGTPFKALQWVSPPPLKPSMKIPRAGESTVRLQSLVKSLAGKWKNKIEEECVRLDNRCVLEQRCEKVIRNEGMPMFSVVTEEMGEGGVYT